MMVGQSKEEEEEEDQMLPLDWQLIFSLDFELKQPEISLRTKAKKH